MPMFDVRGQVTCDNILHMHTRKLHSQKTKYKKTQNMHCKINIHKAGSTLRALRASSSLLALAPKGHERIKNEHTPTIDKKQVQSTKYEN
jgi:archaeosine-15-forming tRNA-guanine transglycosylase